MFVLLLHDSPGDAPHRFGERALETLLGVGLAVFFGAVVPSVFRRIQSRGSDSRPKDY